MVAQHIANGMYGLILVEPEGGLPPVDREFYVMQGEIYTEETYGTAGELTESYEKLLDEQPEYYVFNGAVHGAQDRGSRCRRRSARRSGSSSASAAPTRPRASTSSARSSTRSTRSGRVTGGATH